MRDLKFLIGRSQEKISVFYSFYLLIVITKIKALTKEMSKIFYVFLIFVMRNIFQRKSVGDHEGLFRARV